jgi:hypothetical protein
VILSATSLNSIIFTLFASYLLPEQVHKYPNKYADLKIAYCLQIQEP